MLGFRERRASNRWNRVGCSGTDRPRNLGFVVSSLRGRGASLEDPDCVSRFSSCARHHIRAIWPVRLRGWSWSRRCFVFGHRTRPAGDRKEGGLSVKLRRFGADDKAQLVGSILL